MKKKRKHLRLKKQILTKTPNYASGVYSNYDFIIHLRHMWTWHATMGLYLFWLNQNDLKHLWTSAVLVSSAQPPKQLQIFCSWFSMENGAIPALHINEHHQFLCIYVTSPVNQHVCLKHSLKHSIPKQGSHFLSKNMGSLHPRKHKTVGTWKWDPPLGSGDSLRTPAIFQVSTLSFSGISSTPLASLSRWIWPAFF